MKAILSNNILRWLAWILAGLNILMMGAGMAVQVGMDTPMGGVPFLIHFSEVVALSMFVIIGALIVSWHPRHSIGWIWLLISISFGSDHFAWSYAYYAYIAYPGSLPGAEAMIIWLYWLGRGTLGVLGIILLLLLFPTGRLLSPRWGLVAWLALGITVIKYPINALAPSPPGHFPFPTDLFTVSKPIQAILVPLGAITAIIGLICWVIAALSLFVRLRRAKGVERQQIKWFVYAVSFLPLAGLFITLGGIQSASSPTLLFVLGAAIGVTSTIGMAVASAIAIFRYRLWDIDIIIRRTLVYGALTATLALVYFSTIVLLQGLFVALSGQESAVAVVISTLLIAALFTPLRRRIQNDIDRRFYRRKYDAEKIVATFAAGLREEVNIEQLSERLLLVVEETLQPQGLSLWIKEK